MKDKTVVTIHTWGMDKWHGEAATYVDKLIAEKNGTEYCARCQEEHEHMDWKRLTNPVLSGPEGSRPSAIIAWAMCPKMNEPVLVEAWEDNEDTST